MRDFISPSEPAEIESADCAAAYGSPAAPAKAYLLKAHFVRVALTPSHALGYVAARYHTLPWPPAPDRGTMFQPAWTVKQVAGYLNVDAKMVYRLAQRGELPGFKVGATWRFKRTDVDAWIDEQKQRSRSPESR